MVAIETVVHKTSLFPQRVRSTSSHSGYTLQNVFSGSFLHGSMPKPGNTFGMLLTAMPDEHRAGAASCFSFFMDATGGYPGGVWYSTLLYVTARPAMKAPDTSLYLRGRRCTVVPNEPERTNTARTATSVAPGYAFTCHSGTLRIVRMALLTEPVPRSVRQV